MPQEVNSYLPIAAVLIPIIAFIMILLAQNTTWWRNTWSLLGSAGAFIAVAMMYPDLAGEKIIYTEISMFVTPLNLTFRVDFFGFLIALITSLIWLMSTIFALEYMNHEKNRGRFFAFFMLTLAGTLGVPLTGDLLSLLLFFELMSLASYVLVVHSQNREAFEAGNLYLYLGIFGGMCLLTGMGLFYFSSGSLSLSPQVLLVDGLNNYYLGAAVLMLIGFAIKAGMVPLHIWLPKAHPVAPAPASALLSGLMIKAGAYGMIRIMNIYSPDRELLDLSHISAGVSRLWTALSDAGFIIIWFGLATMLFGATMAIFQDNIKKLLACSSISQIGYIILGIGVAAYLGYEGAMGLGGSIYHILNHAFFKSTLFLAAGAIVYLTGEINMSNLGGLKTRMPFTSVIVLIATLGILGIPLFNGYASKTLLHHAIVEAYEHHHLYSLFIAEKLFILASAGTVCYFLKFIYFTFWRPAPLSLEKNKTEPLLMKIGMGFLAIIMLLIGTSPVYTLKTLVGPALNSFTFDPYLINYLLNTNFWTLTDLGAVVLALLIGFAMFYLIVIKTKAYQFTLPVWLGADYMGTLAAKTVVTTWHFITFPVVGIKTLVDRSTSRLYRRLFAFLQHVDYRPGQMPIFRSINISNIEFDMLLILIALSLILAVVFYIRFGFKLIGV